jgi:diguanylate cyclase (GGDEF)-like protein
MNRAIARVHSAGAIRREERVVAGRVGGIVWLIASLSIVALAFVMPAGQVHRTALIVIGAGGCAWGLLAGLVLDYSRLPVWIIHVSIGLGMIAIATAIALSGGAGSPAWACLFYVVVFAAYFLRPPAAAAYFLACVAVEAIVVFSSSPAARAQSTARLVVAGPAFLVLGAAIIAGKRHMLYLRAQSDRLAAEQAALRRVATAVVSGEAAEHFYQLVAVEAGRLLGASGAGILRLAGSGQATILGSWGQEPARRYRVGDRLPLPANGEVASALTTGKPVQVDDANGSLLGRLGNGSSIVAPIRVAGRTWGFLAVVAEPEASLTPGHTRRLNEFADLISTSVANIEDRAALAAQAATDALTGVGNHRTFHQRLNADLARARRYGSPVSVAIIDVDYFKQVNDTFGHEAGDERLREVARCLHEAARAEDTLARIGGDEFAWILPETSGDEALAAVERARRAILGGRRADEDDGDLRPTISAGVCDSSWTADPSELVRLADRALYFSKEHGRNQVHLYTPSAGELAGVGPES